MWRIRVNQLYSEVGGLISGGQVKFTNSDGFTRTVEGKISGSQCFGYEFTLQGGRGSLKVDHGDRVVVDFEVLSIEDEDSDPPSVKAHMEHVSFEEFKLEVASCAPSV